MNTTKQPLQIVDSLVYRLRDGENVDEINVTMWEGRRLSINREEGARRVKACMNACAGFETDALEQLPANETILSRLQEWQLNCMNAERQRDELLAICKSVVENGIGGNDVRAMRDAIAKSEAAK
jgi:hypothetical protein